MKVATYNIMSGGFTDYDYSLPHPTRLPLIQKAVKAINADFIALIDTFRWDELHSNNKIASMYPASL